MMSLDCLKPFLFSVRYSRLYRVHYKKNMKHYPLLLLLIFASTVLVTDWCSKLLDSTKTLIDKTKNEEDVLSLECTESCSFSTMQLQTINIDKSLRYYITFTLNKSYTYLLNF